MWLLVLISIGTCLRTGVSLNQYDTTVHDPYTSRSQEDNRINPHTDDNRLSPEIGDNRWNLRKEDNRLNPRRNDNQLNRGRIDNRVETGTIDNRLNTGTNENRLDARRNKNRLNPRRNKNRLNSKTNENRLKEKRNENRLNLETNEAHRNGNGNGNGKYVCPADFVRSGNSCYYFSKMMAPWHDAYFNCKDKGAELARMEKRWEDKNMRSYLNKPELARLERWIGGIYNSVSNVWVWGATVKKLRYQGFSRRKPNANYDHRCIVMDPAMLYRWGTRSCVDHKHYICETRLINTRPDLSPDAQRQRKDNFRKMSRRAKDNGNVSQ